MIKNMKENICIMSKWIGYFSKKNPTTTIKRTKLSVLKVQYSLLEYSTISKYSRNKNTYVKKIKIFLSGLKSIVKITDELVNLNIDKEKLSKLKKRRKEWGKKK